MKLPYLSLVISPWCENSKMFDHIICNTHRFIQTIIKLRTSDMKSCVTKDTRYFYTMFRTRRTLTVTLNNCSLSI